MAALSKNWINLDEGGCLERISGHRPGGRGCVDVTRNPGWWVGHDLTSLAAHCHDAPPNRRRGRSYALAGPVDCLPFAARPCSLRVNTAGRAITGHKTYDRSNERVAFTGFGGQTECRNNPMPSSRDVAGQCKQIQSAFQERGRAACPNT